MLGREPRMPDEMAFGKKPPDTPAIPPGWEHARRIQDRLEAAHAVAQGQLENASMRQQRNYDGRARGRHFQAGEIVWVYNPQRKMGRCPELDCYWEGPCTGRGEVVYRVQLPPRGRKVTPHRDRLAPYRWASLPLQNQEPTTRSHSDRDTSHTSRGEVTPGDLWTQIPFPPHKAPQRL